MPVQERRSAISVSLLRAKRKQFDKAFILTLVVLGLYLVVFLCRLEPLSLDSSGSAVITGNLNLADPSQALYKYPAQRKRS